MATMDLAGRSIRGIERYRTSGFREAQRGCCRFEESCSRYGERALREHAFLVAGLLIAWRVLRCNPLTARPSRRVVAVLVLAGFTTFAVSWTAAAAAAPVPRADSADMSGGCRATVGGQPIGALDQDHPLQVYKGQQIVVSGSAPAGARPAPGVTRARIYLVKDLLKFSSFEPTTGTTFRNAVNVDNYLKYGSGVYRVEASSSAYPGWSCSQVFYVELHGSKLAADAAVALGGLGAAGVVLATRGGEPKGSGKDEGTAAGMAAMEQMSELQRDREESERKNRKDAQDALDNSPDRFANAGATTGAGCLTALLFVLILAAGDNTVVAAVPPVTGTRNRVWVKGHTFAGFFSGLVAGLGFLVAGWQFGLYPLTTNNLAFPVVVALVGALRARRGRAWKVA